MPNNLIIVFIFLLKSSTHKDKIQNELKYMAKVLHYLTSILIPQASPMKEALKMNLSDISKNNSNWGFPLPQCRRASAGSDIHQRAAVLQECLRGELGSSEECSPLFTDSAPWDPSCFKRMGREVPSTEQEPSVCLHWGTGHFPLNSFIPTVSLGRIRRNRNT